MGKMCIHTCTHTHGTCVEFGNDPCFLSKKALTKQSTTSSGSESVHSAAAWSYRVGISCLQTW